MISKALKSGLLLLTLAAPLANAQIAVRNQGYVPYSDAPIFYLSDDVDDPVARLKKRIDQGRSQLVHDASGHGYLKSVLKLLDVPVSSQTLVFSKTSFQYPKISPEHPRALYFNDDVYVGVVHEGKEIEVVSFDARQGAIFYLLHEQKVEQPTFERAELDCTQCHIAAGTRGIPGVLLRSVQPTVTGTLVTGAPAFITDQESPLSERWGGWYATGPLASVSLANNVSSNGTSSGSSNAASAGAASDATASTPPVFKAPEKSFDPSKYLAPGSDEVALLVLAHQTQMHNLITLTNYKTRIALHARDSSAAAAAKESGAARDEASPTKSSSPESSPPESTLSESSLPEATRRQYERPAEQLLRYLLFAKEASLPNADGKSLIASSAFAREFAARGPRDSQGRSLRDFDLSTRTFRYPCSYLIYSEAFDALPEPSKTYVYRRLLEILTGADTHPDFQSLSARDRRAILEILLETKPGLPAPWQEYARSHDLRIAHSVSDSSVSEPHGYITSLQTGEHK